ncbi:hypothetical protein TWF703_009043 [Orbilia oligospora]|uniref:RRM domain-containing protein n=1 Tax=Orbilia oligospora TaxID=2813651 RepID=A0A7C8NQ63_ORBOL|nr:hypothetical protein TWF703_009043 [Orbilia oligospora]
MFRQAAGFQNLTRPRIQLPNLALVLLQPPRLHRIPNHTQFRKRALILTSEFNRQPANSLYFRFIAEFTLWLTTGPFSIAPSTRSWPTDLQTIEIADAVLEIVLLEMAFQRRVLLLLLLLLPPAPHTLDTSYIIFFYLTLNLKLALNVILLEAIGSMINTMTETTIIAPENPVAMVEIANLIIRVENLHYDLGEADLRGVFSRVGEIRRIDIIYDKAGRSEGIANVIYATADEAILAVDQFDGANAKGQPIRVRLASQHERGPGGPGGRRGGHGGGMQGGGEGRSLFERVSGTQDAETDDNSGRSSTQRRGGPPRNVQEMRQNAKELGIDRYIPGERGGSRDRRQPPRRGGMGGERERRRDGGGRGGRGGGDRGGERAGERAGGMNRPKKTAEELDAEMNDYWGSTGGDSTVQSAFGPGGTGEHVPQQQPQNGGSNFMAEVNAAAQSSAIDVDEDL